MNQNISADDTPIWKQIKKNLHDSNISLPPYGDFRIFTGCIADVCCSGQFRISNAN